ncbi:MAG: dienelactone hydrolase family protein [Actinobacteria bacterium]|nr:MAG: dienelactone hydrolase family protein [Actinomycetota bacterium]
MCFDIDSDPPIPIISGAAVTHRDLVLAAEDGGLPAAFEAIGGGRVGVVVLPDVRGLYRFYEELALRLAEHGHDAVVIDYFCRTAGTGKRGEDFDYMPEVRQTTYEGVRLDTAAAVAHLRASDRERPVVTLGFCFGGSNSWHQAANGHGLAGAIGFYGHPNRPGFPQGSPAVMARIAEIECPILALQGGDDPGIPVEESDAFRRALTEAGIRNEVVVYEGAPHSFFDRKQADYAAECADAWERVLAFLAEVASPGAS